MNLSNLLTGTPKIGQKTSGRTNTGRVAEWKKEKEIITPVSSCPIFWHTFGFRYLIQPMHGFCFVMYH